MKKGLLWSWMKLSFFLILILWSQIAIFNRLYWCNVGGDLAGVVHQGAYAEAGITCEDDSVEVKRKINGTLVYRCGGGELHVWPFYRTMASPQFTQWWEKHTEKVVSRR
jgi:hypothetical protein